MWRWKSSVRFSVLRGTVCFSAQFESCDCTQRWSRSSVLAQQQVSERRHQVSQLPVLIFFTRHNLMQHCNTLESAHAVRSDPFVRQGTVSFNSSATVMAHEAEFAAPRLAYLLCNVSSGIRCVFILDRPRTSNRQSDRQSGTRCN